MMGWDTALYFMIASIVLTAVLAPKAQIAPPVSFDEIDFPQVDEGTPQSVFFGDCWTDNWLVISVGNYRTQGLKAKGGKK